MNFHQERYKTNDSQINESNTGSNAITRVLQNELEKDKVQKDISALNNLDLEGLDIRQKEKLLKYFEKLTSKTNKDPRPGRIFEFVCLSLLSIVSGCFLITIGVLEQWNIPITFGVGILGCLLYEIKDIPSRINLCRPRRNSWILLIIVFSAASTFTFLFHYNIEKPISPECLIFQVLAGLFWGYSICILFIDRLKFQMMKYYEL